MPDQRPSSAGVDFTTTAEYRAADQAGPPSETLAPANAGPEGCRLPSAVHVSGYTILEALGRGGMGVVYKARQDKANRLVALKMILSGAHASPAERQRFHAEAEVVARLAHPHIVQVYEVGETPEGHSFFSLELMAGGTLAGRLRQGPLAPVEAAILLEALSRAIQHAHEHGVVHRDVKPQNVLLAGNPSSSAGSAGTLQAGEMSGPAAGPPLAMIPKISDCGRFRLSPMSFPPALLQCRPSPP